MSAPNKEYLIAKATLCRDLAVNQILAGEGEQAARNLMRMVKALGEIGIINEREDKAMSKWEMKEDSDVSFWHCGRAGYWEGQDVYCSKCQTKLEEESNE